MTEEEKLAIHLSRRSIDIVLVILNLIASTEKGKHKLLDKLDINQSDLNEINQAISKAKEVADKHLGELYR